MKEKIQKLRQLIEYHNSKYFNDQDPEISDQEYDLLFAELKTLEQQYPELDDKNSPTHLVGGTAENTFEKIEHKIPMLSLQKAMNWEEFDVWFRKMYNQGIREFIFELKYDGLACTLHYGDSKFKVGATRGDGRIGEDITVTASLVPNIPKTISNSNDIEVRGEILLLKSGLDELNKKRIAAGQKPYENVRNAASGILRTKNPDPDISKYLRFGPYMLATNNNNNFSHKEDMDYLTSLGFYFTNDMIGKMVLNINEIKDVNEALKYVKDSYFETATKTRDYLDFDIDGIVCKANLYSDQAKLGAKEGTPNWAIAYKFEAQGAVTQIIGVEHLLGSKGNITPRSILKPVKIGGTTVTKPTLHNYDEIKRLDVKIGDYVVVERRGDVIPKIVKVLKELRTGNETDILPPTHCPECGESLTLDGAFYRCDNNECSGRQMYRVQNYITSVEIDEFGPKVIEKLIESGKIDTFPDIYNLTIDDISNLERMGIKSATKLINNIEKSKSAPLSRIIAGFTIKNVGYTTGKDLADKYKDLGAFSKATYQELSQMNGIGPITGQYIVNWLSNSNNQELIQRLLEIGIGKDQEVKPIISSNKLNNSKFAFTGALSMPRKQVEDIIVNNGGEVFSIKKGLEYLIIGSGAKQHKIDKANELGAKVITEEEFIQMVK